MSSEYMRAGDSRFFGFQSINSQTPVARPNFQAKPGGPQPGNNFIKSDTFTPSVNEGTALKNAQVSFHQGSQRPNLFRQDELLRQFYPLKNTKEPSAKTTDAPAASTATQPKSVGLLGITLFGSDPAEDGITKYSFLAKDSDC